MANLKETYERAEIHEEWESLYRGNPRLDRINDRLMDRIVSALQAPGGAAILDAGCGVGDHTLRIARRGYRCVGLDISRHILAQARRRVEREGLEDRVELLCAALEDLPFSADSFDAIHCRGVLMHVPDWQRALSNLCRVLKPGGRIAILEDNDRSLHAALVLAARAVPWRRSKSALVRSPEGLQFWSREDGVPFVYRMANIRALTHRLERHRVVVLERFPTSLIDITLLPPGWPRNAAIRLNQLASLARTPAALCKGNVLIAEKQRPSAIALTS
jgi:ubiquinone/menaquinone biosynthesis C-methylase UbiE